MLLYYCMRCKAKTESNSVEQIVMKNGKDAVSSLCAVCGTKKFCIGKLPVEAGSGAGT